MLKFMFGKGYLGKEVIKNIPGYWVIAKSLKDIKNDIYAKGTEIWYFACPTDNFKEDKERLYDSLEITRELTELCWLYEYKLIYANSMGAYNIDAEKDKYQKCYNALKLVNTTIIEESGCQYLILDIPRVYSYDKPSGLIKRLKDGTFKGKDFEVEFILLQDFIKELKDYKIENNHKSFKTQTQNTANLLDYLKAQNSK